MSCPPAGLYVPVRSNGKFVKRVPPWAYVSIVGAATSQFLCLEVPLAPMVSLSIPSSLTLSPPSFPPAPLFLFLCSRLTQAPPLCHPQYYTFSVISNSGVGSHVIFTGFGVKVMTKVCFEMMSGLCWSGFLFLFYFFLILLRFCKLK